MASSSDVEKEIEVLQNLNSLIQCGDLNKVNEFMERENPSPDIFEKLQKICWRRGMLSDHPVCLAAKTGHVDIMNFLISAGFNAEGADHGDWRPIHYAANTGRLDVLESLVVQHKVNVDDINSHYDTAMFLAIENGHLEIVKFLVESEASVDYYEAMHFTTALHLAAENNPEICEYLISVGADVNAEEKIETTPLHTAAYAGSAKSAEVLLDNGADVNSSTEQGITPFIAGIGKGNLDLIKVLYSRDGDPECEDDEDNTPLHLSVSRGAYDITRYLAIDVGVSLDKKNGDDDTPFGIAMENGDKSTAQLLIRAGYNPGKEVCIYDDNSLDKMLKNDDGKQFVKYVRQVAINPRCLQEICCFQIRRLLGRDVPSLVDSLPIPHGLKDIVMLCHV